MVFNHPIPTQCETSPHICTSTEHPRTNSTTREREKREEKYKYDKIYDVIGKEIKRNERCW